jgi:two-component system, cell cycle sensor histidine kinase and response regulator CckA
MSGKNGKNVTVLVVDDEDCLLRLAHSVLTPHGFNVLVGHGPIDALQIAASHPGDIDLLLTDVRMPGMDGPTLTREMRAFHPESKVVYMTAYSPDELDESLSLEVILQKPFGIQDLFDTVSQLLNTES